MKFSLFMAAFALLAVFPLTAKAMEGEKPSMATMEEAPAIKAVVFYSDSCGSCKILEPRMAKAMNAINTDKIDVVKFNFSNKDSIEATKALATSKGVDNILQEYGAKTGFVVLVNGKGDVVETLKVDHDAPEIAAKLATAITNAS